jgi:F420H(2)-dependent quinone reductase
MNTSAGRLSLGRGRALINFPAAIYHWLRRRIHAHMEPAQILLLTTTRSVVAEPQTIAMGYFKEGDDLVVVGSNYGSDLHPTWYLNLRAHPQVRVQVDDDLQNMIASTATSTERARLSLRLATEDKNYGRYQQNTAREIPIVLLHPSTPFLTGRRTDPDVQMRRCDRCAHGSGI